MNVFTKLSTHIAISLFALIGFAQQDVGTFSIKLNDGDPIPGTNLTIDLDPFNLPKPRMTNSGIVYFLARGLPGSQQDSIALFSLSDSNQNQLKRLLHVLQPTPQLDGRISSIRDFIVADDGTAYVVVRLENITAFGNEAIYRIDQSGQLIEILREGKQLLNSNFVVCSPNGISNSAMNPSGVITAILSVQPVAGGSCRKRLFSILPNGNVNELAAEGSQLQFGSSGNQITTVLDHHLAIGASGEISFTANTSDEFSILLVIRNGVIQRVREFRNGSTNVFHTASDNILFTVTETSSTGPALFRHDLINGQETILMQRGDILPNGDGAFFDIWRTSVSADGQVLLLANLTATPGGDTDSIGLYVFSGNSIKEIARLGRNIADNTIIRSFFVDALLNGPASNVNPSISSQGRVLFEVGIDQNQNNEIMVMFYNTNTGLINIINRDTIIEDLFIQKWYMPLGLNESGNGAMLLRQPDGVISLATYSAPNVSNQPPSDSDPPPGAQIDFNVIEGNWVNSDPLFNNNRQGLMFDFGPSLDLLFVAWFTYTSIPIMPPASPLLDVGSNDQRWFTGLLTINGNMATGTLRFSEGGEFDGPATVFQQTREAGIIGIQFLSCDKAIVSYAMANPSLSRTFEIIPLEKSVNPDGFSCQ